MQCVLAEVRCPDSRAELLAELEACAAIQTRFHNQAFSPRERRGCCTYEDHRNTASLLRLVREAEAAVLTVGSTRRAWHDLYDTELAQAAAPVLDRIAQAHDLAERMELIRGDLYDAVYPIVGGQAAEVLACLPAPGWRMHQRRVTGGEA